MASGQAILAIDPGERNCGFVLYDEGKIVKARNVTPEELFKILEKESFETVIIEEFRLFPQMAPHLIFSKMKTVETIGVVKYIARKREKRIVEQSPHVKTLFKDDTLKKANIWNKNRHVRDAIKHILYFLRFKKGVFYGQVYLRFNKE